MRCSRSSIGVLLNAPGAHKSAYNKSDGWQRDVALALTGPLAGVSHALLLDRPRKGVQAVIGRSGEDEIDTKIALPSARGADAREPDDADQAASPRVGPQAAEEGRLHARSTSSRSGSPATRS